MKSDILYNSYPPAVVVGLSITGLGTVRALAKAGVNVIGVDSDFSKPSAHTRYCRKVPFKNINDKNDLLENLIEIGKREKRKPVLFLSTDMSVMAVSEAREHLRKYYRFNLPSKSIVKMLMEKTLFSDFAKKNNIKIPQTFIADDLHSIQSVERKIQYPCLIKPSYRNPTWDKATPIKVFKAYSDKELVNIYKKNFYLSESFVIQELIPGPDREVYFCLLWYNSSSRVLASVTGRKPMQWVPETGSTCVAETCSNDIVLEESIKLFNILKYKGIGSVEYKRDHRDNTFKVIEPTVGRVDLQSGIAYYYGINIPLLEYCDCLGIELPKTSTQKREIFWINEENLLWVLGNERKRYPFRDWLRLAKSRKYFALFDILDINPFLRFLSFLVKKLLLKIGKV